jgi:prophage DNA circulation protein
MSDNNQLPLGNASDNALQAVLNRLPSQLLENLTVTANYTEPSGNNIFRFYAGCSGSDSTVLTHNGIHAPTGRTLQGSAVPIQYEGG